MQSPEHPVDSAAKTAWKFYCTYFSDFKSSFPGAAGPSDPERVNLSVFFALMKLISLYEVFVFGRCKISSESSTSEHEIFVVHKGKGAKLSLDERNSGMPREGGQHRLTIDLFEDATVAIEGLRVRFDCSRWTNTSCFAHTSGDCHMGNFIAKNVFDKIGTPALKAHRAAYDLCYCLDPITRSVFYGLWKGMYANADFSVIANAAVLKGPRWVIQGIQPILREDVLLGLTAPDKQAKMPPMNHPQAWSLVEKVGSENVFAEYVEEIASVYKEKKTELECHRGFHYNLIISVDGVLFRNLLTEFDKNTLMDFTEPYTRTHEFKNKLYRRAMDIDIPKKASEPGVVKSFTVRSSDDSKFWNHVIQAKKRKLQREAKKKEAEDARAMPPPPPRAPIVVAAQQGPAAQPEPTVVVLDSTGDEGLTTESDSD